MIATTNYSQLDPRWKNKKIGKTNQVLGMYGCTITSLCNLVNSQGYNETPDTFNQKMTAARGYLGALVIWGVVSKVWPRLRFIWRGGNYNNVKVAYYVYIKKIPVMVEVYNTASPTRRHWVLFIGDRKLIDPLGGIVRSTSYFRTLTGYALYDK